MLEGTYTLGLTLLGHDTSCTILDNEGVPMIIAEEERYSRLKKGTFFPSPQRWLSVLSEVGISEKAITRLAVANIPEMIEERSSVSKAGDVPYHHSVCNNYVLRNLLKYFTNVEEIIWVKHHKCHAASAYYPSPFSESAIITIDGMGEDETACIWHGKGGQIQKLFSIKHPHSVGYFYQVMAQWVGLTGAEREGKLMGLSSYGIPKYIDLLRKNFIYTDPQNGFSIHEDLASIPCQNSEWLDYFSKILGPIREPKSPITDYHRDIAASTQKLLEEIVFSIAILAKSLTKSKNCVMAGGVFMNSIANGKLRRAKVFQNVWIQPLASDNGLSLGAALWAHQLSGNQHVKWEMTHPFLGSPLQLQNLKELITRSGNNQIVESNNIELETARYLAEGRIVGWVQGRSEVGARALGHRSILADPRSIHMRDKLNQMVKFREKWRPFAPMMLEEDARRIVKEYVGESVFMQFVEPIAFPHLIPGAVHIDHTARLQTVSKAFDKRLFSLLVAFKEITGIGCLINTSLNVQGEPIVRTVEEAVNVFQRGEIDILVIGNFIISKKAIKGTGPSLSKTKIHLDLAISKYVKNEKSALIDLRREANNTMPSSLSDHLRWKELSGGNGLSIFYLISEDISLREISICSINGSKKNSINELVVYKTILLLVPVWIELAENLIKNLLYPFFRLKQQFPILRVVLLDASGNEKDISISDIEEFNNLLGKVAPISPIEKFWIKHKESR